MEVQDDSELSLGVPEPSLPKSGSLTIQKNIVLFKNRSPSTKNGSSGLQISSYVNFRTKNNGGIRVVTTRRHSMLRFFSYFVRK